MKITDNVPRQGYTIPSDFDPISPVLTAPNLPEYTGKELDEMQISGMFIQKDNGKFLCFSEYLLNQMNEYPGANKYDIWFSRDTAYVTFLRGPDFDPLNYSFSYPIEESIRGTLEETGKKPIFSINPKTLEKRIKFQI